jgi:hypothetical protein
VNRTISVLRAMRINVLFTCVPEDQVPLVYAPPALPDLRRTVTVLTGYVPPELLERQPLPYADRPVDVGYRARRLPPWLGLLGMEKAEIADRFAADAPAFGLHADISTAEEDRLYGERWVEFLGRAKAMLGVESGASVFDFDGSIEERTRAYLLAHPDAGFADVHRDVLAEVDGRIRLNQISPRCFEAAALGTLLVLYPGSYSGVLEPWRHYVPLEKDHRNMREVVDVIRDQAAWQRITAQARSEVAENPRYSYQAMVALMDDALELTAGATASLTAGAFERTARHSFANLPVTRLHAGPLAKAGRRILRMARSASRMVTPSPTAPVLYPPGTEIQRDLRRRNRLARARAAWVLRPRTLPPKLRRQLGEPLLEELSELTSMQRHGQHAMAVAAGSPFAIVADPAASTLRIGLGSDVPTDADPVDRLPENLGWVNDVVVSFGERWFVPLFVGLTETRRLGALSTVFQTNPEIGRTLVAGDAPWCTVFVVREPPSTRPPPADAGAA